MKQSEKVIDSLCKQTVKWVLLFKTCTLYYLVEVGNVVGAHEGGKRVVWVVSLVFDATALIRQILQCYFVFVARVANEDKAKQLSLSLSPSSILILSDPECAPHHQKRKTISILGKSIE